MTWPYTKTIFRKMAKGYIQKQSSGKLQMALYKGNLKENGKWLLTKTTLWKMANDYGQRQSSV